MGHSALDTEEGWVLWVWHAKMSFFIQCVLCFEKLKEVIGKYQRVKINWVSKEILSA